MGIYKFILKIYYYIEYRIYSHIICRLFFKKKYEKMEKIDVKNIKDTVDELINSNKSIGRYGDGELSWAMCQNNGINNFEKKSKLLSERLLEVLNNDRKNFMVGLPDSMNDIYNKHYTRNALTFWKRFYTKKSDKISKIINNNKLYYNANVTRPYMDYNSNEYAKEVFFKLRKIWNGKKVLIVEGKQSKLGYNDDLLSGCEDVKRIECPIINAFESYETILEKTLEFLNEHNEYVTLISLGPTATVMAYDLCKEGHRAIDIGHIDVEYEWYLVGAKEKISLPDKYVNEVKKGRNPDKMIDHSHDDEIICSIKNDE